MAHVPNSELVFEAWLKGIDGVPPNGVGTTLPGDNTTWAASGFVQYSVVGGSPGVYVPEREPVFTVDCWAVRLNSAKPPWGMANNLAETIVEACYQGVDETIPTARVVTISRSGYEQARVQSAYPLTEPRRMPGDEARFARYQFDLALFWVRVPS